MHLPVAAAACRCGISMLATPSSTEIALMPGVSAPLGFFDPVGFTSDASVGRVKFLREVEIKHSRVAMLAALGFPFAEQFHPLWGGKIDVPSVVAFQQTPLQTFWPAILLPIGIIEVFSVFTFNSPFGGELWSIRSDYENGNLGWDPLGLCAACPPDACIQPSGVLCEPNVLGPCLFLQETQGWRRAKGNEDQGAEQRAPCHDCHCWHGWAGTGDRPEAVLIRRPMKLVFGRGHLQ